MQAKPVSKIYIFQSQLNEVKEYHIFLKQCVISQCKNKMQNNRNNIIEYQLPRNFAKNSKVASLPL